MRESIPTARQRLVLLYIVVALACILGLWSLVVLRNPALSITYLGAIDGNGQWRLQFAITNVGNSTVFSPGLGRIEVFNRTNVLSVGATPRMSQLAPGQGHVVEAVLSETQMKSIDG